MVFENRCILVLWTKVASALEGLTHLYQERFRTNVVCTYNTFDDNYGMNHKFTNYLKEGCGLGSGRQQFIKYFTKKALITKM